MNPLNLIPLQYRVMALAIAVVLILGAVFAAGDSRGSAAVQAEWDKATSKQLLQVAAAELASRNKEQSMQQQLNEAQNAATERENKLRADYAAANAAALGLRDTVAAIRGRVSSASPEACRATADVALAVFGQCASRLGELAQAADGHASDVETLTEAWPK